MAKKKIIILGTQWGDEGKGKIIDYLARKSDVVVRAGGGANAGHTVVIGKKKYALHLIPSGVLNKKVINIIGNGVAFDIEAFLEEIENLTKDKIDTKNIFISDRAHIVFPYHKKIDELKELKRGNKKIGTTNRGIGPCYMDKFERVGIRVGDILNEKAFLEKLQKNIEEKNEIIKKIYNAKPLNKKKVLAQYKTLIKKIKHRVVDSCVLLDEKIKANKKILFEGAQATMLDIDHGTYPFVTSSNPTSGGFSVGTGSKPEYDEIIGVMKAYTTRVGAGPFVTEQNNKTGDHIRERGKEYGTTTGRPRRCGWLDLVVLKHAAMVNGLTALSLMLLDVLDDFDEIKVCIGYKVGNKVVKTFPASLEILEKSKPIYKTVKGWEKDLSKVKEYKDLPKEAKDYIKLIENETKVKVKIISVGPERTQTIIRDTFF